MSAHKLRLVIAATTKNDTVGRAISDLNMAMDEERYKVAAIRDHAGAGLLGWWSGISENLSNPYGLIIRISAGNGGESGDGSDIEALVSIDFISENNNDYASHPSAEAFARFEKRDHFSFSFYTEAYSKKVAAGKAQQSSKKLVGLHTGQQDYGGLVRQDWVAACRRVFQLHLLHVDTYGHSCGKCDDDSLINGICHLASVPVSSAKKNELLLKLDAACINPGGKPKLNNGGMLGISYGWAFTWAMGLAPVHTLLGWETINARPGARKASNIRIHGASGSQRGLKRDLCVKKKSARFNYFWSSCPRSTYYKKPYNLHSN